MDGKKCFGKTYILILLFLLYIHCIPIKTTQRLAYYEDNQMVDFERRNSCIYNQNRNKSNIHEPYLITYTDMFL